MEVGLARDASGGGRFGTVDRDSRSFDRRTLRTAVRANSGLPRGAVSVLGFGLQHGFEGSSHCRYETIESRGCFGFERRRIRNGITRFGVKQRNIGPWARLRLTSGLLAGG